VLLKGLVSVSLQLKLLELLFLLSWLRMTALDRSAGIDWAAGVVITDTGIFGSSDIASARAFFMEAVPLKSL